MPSAPTRPSIVKNMLWGGPRYASTFSYHSSGEWALPPRPPPPKQIAGGIPRAIGMFASVLRGGLPDKEYCPMLELTHMQLGQ